MNVMPKRVHALCLLACVCLSPFASRSPGAQQPKPSAQAAGPSAPDVAGEWRGALEIAGVGKLDLILKLKREAGALAGALDSPAQGATNLPLAEVTYADRVLRFVLPTPGAPGVYEGSLSGDGAELAGHWEQGGARRPLFFARAGAPAAAASPQTFARGRVPLEPCAKQNLTKNALCGRYEVFEDRAAKSGRKIALRVVLLPALAEKPEPDPVFYFAGGPGGGASMYAGAPFMTRLRRRRDVVMVDQRGTGESNPLRCDFHPAGDLRAYFGEMMPAEAVAACRARLEKIADLRLYTTPVAMADLDEVREAMGYERVNVSGGSYGSTAALAYLRLYPRRVRAAAVNGVAPVDYKMALPFAKGVEHALERLFADCAADARCKTAFPDLRREFDETVARLAKEPAGFEATNPATGQRQRVTLTRDVLMDQLRALLYFPGVINLLPALIHEMHAGTYARFAAVAYQIYRQMEPQIARGMHLSVVCSESIPFITEDDIRRETAGTLYGDARLRAYQRACREWPRGSLPSDFRTVPKADVPVLMISGDFDPVTPPWLGAAALAAHYPRGRQIVVHNGTHASYECTERVAAEFIDRGTTEGLDASCVEKIQRLPFVTSLPPQK